MTLSCAIKEDEINRLICAIEDNDLETFKEVLHEGKHLSFLNNSTKIKHTYAIKSSTMPRTILEFIVMDESKHQFVNYIVGKFGKSIECTPTYRGLDGFAYEAQLNALEMLMHTWGIHTNHLTLEIENYLNSSENKARLYEFYICGLNFTCKGNALKELFPKHKDLSIGNSETVMQLIESDDVDIGLWAILNNSVTDEAVLLSLLNSFYEMFDDISPIQLLNILPEKYKSINLTLMA